MSHYTTCPSCGMQNVEGTAFCGACGTQLPSMTHAPAPPPIPPPTQPMHPTYGAPMVSTMIPCRVCGAVTQRENAFNTSLFVFLFCCLGLCPGIIYYMLRSGKYRCPSCGNIE